MARLSITNTAPLPSLPLVLFSSQVIGSTIVEPFGTCDIIVGLDEEMVVKLIKKSRDASDEALAQTSDSVRFATPESYEAWLMKRRTPFILIHRDTQELMALMWIGPEPFTMENAQSQNPNAWDTIAYRSYLPYRGGGFMTDFTRFILDVYRAQNPERKLWASIAVDNTGSQTLAGKLGFSKIESGDETSDRVIMTLI